MALFVNVNMEHENENDHEMFEFWKGWKFPGLKIISNDDHERAGKVMMDKELYALAKDNKFNKLFQLLSTKDEVQLLSIFGKHVGPSGNSLLHGAAGSGSRATSELLAHHFPLLITKKNFKGDTALHVAAGRGYVDTVQTLLHYVASDPFTGGSGGDEKARELLRMRNDRGNTCLHEAVKNGKNEVAKLLARADPEVLYWKNHEDKCPLYLAVEVKKKELLCSLLDAIKDMPTATSLPEGISVAHAALDLNRDMLSEIAKRKPELMHVKDENGDNLLHLASSKEEWNWCKEDWASDLFGDCAIETNNQGHLPIHVACQNGHLGAVKWFLDQWPDPTEFLNVKGQTVLHVAAESGKHKLVRSILNEPEFEEIINERDMEGNTALHLATKNSQYMSVYALVNHKTINKDIRDGENMTAYCTALHLAKREEERVSDDKPISYVLCTSCCALQEKIRKAIREPNDGTIIHKTTGKEQAGPIVDDSHQMAKQDDEPKHAITDGKKKQHAKGNPFISMGVTLSILFFHANDKAQALKEYLVESESDPPLVSREELRSRINSLLVVSVLVAGVTFAGTIQVPGGGNIGANLTNTSSSSSSSSSFFHSSLLPLPKKEALFQGFEFYNMLAFNLSLLSSIILCWEQLYNTKVATIAVWVASFLIRLSIYMMCIAFALAMEIAVVIFSSLFIFFVVLEVSFLVVQALVSIPMDAHIQKYAFSARVVGIPLSPAFYFAAFKVCQCFMRMFDACFRRPQISILTRQRAHESN